MREKKIWQIFITYFVVLGMFMGVTVLGNQAVTAFSDTVQRNQRTMIIIDPGHGGMDGGATSCTGIPESKLNLEISLRLRDLLHLLGYRTTMIRTTDTSVHTKGNTIAGQKLSDLKERVRVVSSFENGILISIHQNTFSEQKYHGAQIFFADTPGSRDLAEKLQETLVATLNPGSKRKAKQAEGIYLLDKIENTGILVECGFLSNPEEERMLRSKAYQNQLCCVIASSLDNYLSES